MEINEENYGYFALCNPDRLDNSRVIVVNHQIYTAHVQGFTLRYKGVPLHNGGQAKACLILWNGIGSNNRFEEACKLKQIRLVSR